MFPTVCLSVCLSLRMPVCLLACLQCVCMCGCVGVWLWGCVRVYVCVHLSVWVSACLPIYLSMCLCMYVDGLFECLSVHLSVYPSASIRLSVFLSPSALPHIYIKSVSALDIISKVCSYNQIRLSVYSIDNATFSGDDNHRCSLRWHRRCLRQLEMDIGGLRRSHLHLESSASLHSRKSRCQIFFFFVM